MSRAEERCAADHLDRTEDEMDLLQGTLLTGAAATGVVIAERARQRGSREEVREELAAITGRAAGAAGMDQLPELGLPG